MASGEETHGALRVAVQLSERDRRQLELMKRRLALYEGDEIHLRTLIADLDFLIEAFESVDPTWRLLT